MQQSRNTGMCLFTQLKNIDDFEMQNNKHRIYFLCETKKDIFFSKLLVN